MFAEYSINVNMLKSRELIYIIYIIFNMSEEIDHHLEMQETNAMLLK